MARRLLLSLLAASALCGGAAATPLEEVIAKALEASPALKADQATLEANEQAVASARAAGLPEITLSASAAYSVGTYDAGEDGDALLASLFADGGGVPLSPDGGISNPQAALSITQPLFTGLRIKNGIAQARADVKAARGQFEAKRQNTAFQIAAAYLEVVVADAQISSVQKSLESLTQQARAAQVSFEAGQSTRTDTALAEAQVAGVRAQLAHARVQVVAARNQYQVLAGDLPDEFTLDETLPPLPESADEAIQTARRINPNLMAAAALVTAREAAQRRAKGERSPQLSLRGSLSYVEDSLLQGDTSENASVVAQMSVPLYRGGATSASVRRAKADARASRFSLTDLERQVDANIRTRFAQFQAARVTREAAAARVTAADLAYRGVKLEQEVGQRNILDVLQVEESLLAARLADVQARRDHVLAAYQLRLAIGDLVPPKR